MKSSEAAPVGVCGVCGKLSFLSRKAARANMRKVHPGESMQVYTCGIYFHYGHSPYVVSRGVISRNNLMKRG
jgi:hypothetical protein